MSKMKTMITLALVALGITAFTTNALADGKTYGIDAGDYVYPHPSDTNPCDEHGSRYTHYVMKQADAQAAMGTTATVTYQTMAAWLGKDFAANKASVIANAEKIDFDDYDQGQYYFEKRGGTCENIGDAIGVFFYDDGANRAYNVMSNIYDDNFYFDDEKKGTSSDWMTPTPELPTEPIEAKPVAVVNATAEVYTNGYLSAKVSAHGWAAWSNQTATVVYTAAKGYLFADGSTVATNKLDTAVDPAVNAKGEVVPVAGKPAIELGVVAQRYPWDGKVDAHYRAKNWPKEGTFGSVEIKVGDTVVTNALNIFKSGEGVQVIDMKLLFGEKAEKAQFKALILAQPIDITTIETTLVEPAE